MYLYVLKVTPAGTSNKKHAPALHKQTLQSERDHGKPSGDATAPNLENTRGCLRTNVDNLRDSMLMQTLAAVLTVWFGD